MAIRLETPLHSTLPQLFLPVMDWKQLAPGPRATTKVLRSTPAPISVLSPSPSTPLLHRERLSSTVTVTIVQGQSSHYQGRLRLKFHLSCGSTDVGASPFFNGLVSDGRPLTNAEVILYEKTGWRITAPGKPSIANLDLTNRLTGGLSTVDLTLSGTTVSFSGNGYKDSNWGPNAMNDFVRSWYVLIAEVGPFSFVSFTGQPLNGTNSVNSGHLSYNGQFLTSQCNIVGEQNTDIAIITPTGEVEDSDVIAPTGFNLTFVLANGTGITFLANNLAVNPSVSIYHRWVAKWTVTAGGQDYEGYGITEWMNTANLSHWELIQ